MNPQVQEVKKIMSRVNKKKKKKHRHIKVKILKIKKKGCQEKKKTATYYIQMCWDLKKEVPT